MSLVYHYTDKKGFNGIRAAHPDWLFKAHEPPGNHPPGAYFSSVPPNHARLSRTLMIPLAKLEYVFEFEDIFDLKPLRGFRGDDRISVFYPRNYIVVPSRQRYNGLRIDWKE